MAKKLDEILTKKGKNDDPKAAKMAKIAEACAKLQAKFGKENVNYLGNKKVEKIPRIPSGSDAIDRVTGGGYPLGRIIEISGGPSAGKTTACYHALAEAQKMYPDDFCGFVDSEYSADWLYAESLGVDKDSLMISQPDDGHDAFGIIQGMIEAGARLIVVDSVAAMIPKEEREEDDYSKAGVAQQARMMSRGLRKLAGIAGKYQCVVIFTNQLRDNVGVLWGDKSTTTGGKALQYYASIRLKFTRTGKVEEKDGDEKLATAIETKVESVKNKTYRPYLKDKITVVFGKGIDNDAGILDTAISEGIIKKKGSWFAIDGENVAQGLPVLREYLDQHPDVFERIKKATKEATKLDEVEATNTNTEPDADDLTDEEIEKRMASDDTDTGEV